MEYVLRSPLSMYYRARRNRKILGGAMRQAGVLAAAGIYALENNVQKLKKDHSNAEEIAQGTSFSLFESHYPGTKFSG